MSQVYLRSGELSVYTRGGGIAWLDAGTHESLLQASNYIHAVEERQGLMISCPEEIAYRMGFIDPARLSLHAEALASNEYGAYLFELLEAKH